MIKHVEEATVTKVKKNGRIVITLRVSNRRRVCQAPVHIKCGADGLVVWWEHGGKTFLPSLLPQT